MKEIIHFIGIACALGFTISSVLFIIAAYGWQYLMYIIGCIPIIIITAAAIKYLNS